MYNALVSRIFILQFHKYVHHSNIYNPCNWSLVCICQCYRTTLCFDSFHLFMVIVHLRSVMLFRYIGRPSQQKRHFIIFIFSCLCFSWCFVFMAMLCTCCSVELKSLNFRILYTVTENSSNEGFHFLKLSEFKQWKSCKILKQKCIKALWKYLSSIASTACHFQELKSNASKT